MRDLQLDGELYLDEAHRHIYATDASAYREIPMGVAVPYHAEDIKKLVGFAQKENVALIPRTAGTSLAGQVVGSGLVVDFSKMNRIEGFQESTTSVWVEPGVVRDELNRHLKDHEVFFAPETSTANRAMIGGMLGNNSCGTNSIKYGSTREHVLEVEGFLSDGSFVQFGPLDEDGFEAKCELQNLEGQLYRSIRSQLTNTENRKEIDDQFPRSDIFRRNTGYALDRLADTLPFGGNRPFNFCELLAGSEGTLMLTTRIHLSLTPLPSPHTCLIAIHCQTLDESLRANLVALDFDVSASELMDHYILEATERNALYREERFFIKGQPQALLVVQLHRASKEDLQTSSRDLIKALTDAKLGFHYPVLAGSDIPRVWGLRKAGLGLLSNIPGDAKPAPVIEDTAVHVKDLPDYIKDFNAVLQKYDLDAVHYAHASAGELHLRPILDLKTKEGIRLFRSIAEEVADLVKTYRGSLSGEHGDGRLRGEFIPKMMGKVIYGLFQELKSTWDPHGLFNPGKITDTAPMDQSLRFGEDWKTPDFQTGFDFSAVKGLVRAAEMCNGSGDCRKSHNTGGAMCPSYQATRNEKDTTRARANMLRELLNEPNPFERPELGEVMDLCLSCKACKKECPSNVDMARLKAEWQHQVHQIHGSSWRDRQIAGFAKQMRLVSRAPWLYNALRLGAKKVMGFHADRSIPKVHRRTLQKWIHQFQPSVTNPKKRIALFIDEFTNYLDVPVGQKTVKLLDRLGYQCIVLPHAESGRTYLSKGFLDEAERLARQNVSIFRSQTSTYDVIVGMEPSAILTFRDEYPDLLRGKDQEDAKEIAAKAKTLDEFLAAELDAGHLDPASLEQQANVVWVHGHCHQKALSSQVPMVKVLKAAGYEVRTIPTGCCGMAGSFGYDKEHFDVSMNVGELVLFPTVRKIPEGDMIIANGTSCRHQIKDGTSRRTFHLAEVV